MIQGKRFFFKSYCR